MTNPFPDVSGAGGQLPQFQVPTYSKGFPTKLLPLWGQTADFITAGSAGAGEALRQGYEDQFRVRAGGAQAASQMQARRLAAEGSAQGISGDVLRRLTMGGNLGLQRSVGDALGETRGGYANDLASLRKGTGGELANLNHSMTSTLLEAYMQSAARKLARKGAKQAFVGSILGTVGKIPQMFAGGGMGGGAQAAGSSAAGSGAGM